MVTERVQDYGQHWKEPERVQEYVSRTDRREAERGYVLRLMAGLAPFEQSAPVRVLDIGSGHGPVAAAILDAFPKGSAVGLDMSDAMMEVGRNGWPASAIVFAITWVISLTGCRRISWDLRDGRSLRFHPSPAAG